MADVEQRDDAATCPARSSCRLAEAGVRGEVELRAERRREVRAERFALLRFAGEAFVADWHVQRSWKQRTLERRHLDRAELVVDVAAGEEANRLVAAAHVHAEQAAAAEVR